MENKVSAKTRFRKIIRPRLKMKIHHEGTEYIIISLFISTIVCCALYFLTRNNYPFLFYTTAFIFLVLNAIMINFFRSPIRENLCEDPSIVFAPADGVIVAIEEVEENEYFHERRIMISIFMNLFNVHANWYPVAGTVKKVGHQKGRFMGAYLPKASTENERSMLVIEALNGQEVMARQIAGAMARRIVTYPFVGDECYINEHFGFIKFGSRVDVYLPLDAKVLIKPNQQTIGSQTPIAQLTKLF